NKKAQMDRTLTPAKMVVLTLSVLTLLCSLQEFAIAGETTDITGTITARRLGAVKVEFKAHPKAGPKVGDKVDFKTEIQGFEAKAGKGEVTEVESSHVWVKVLEKNPKLKMTGIIHATGLPVTQKSRSPEAGIVKGSVTRGWLGVMIQKITPELAKSFGLEGSDGALVGDVIPDSPAYKAGIKRGDVIVRFDNKEVAEMEALPKIVAQTPAGSTVNVNIIRNGRNKVLEVTLEARKEEKKPQVARWDPGLMVHDITPEIMETLRLDSNKGVLVSEVTPDGPADKAGIQKEDVILEVNRTPLNSVSDYHGLTSSVRKGSAPLFLVRRGGATIFIAVKDE
ncbi:MAG: PDZ domain-containing protein, partial [Nitrospinales bacterium]